MKKAKILPEQHKSYINEYDTPQKKKKIWLLIFKRILQSPIFMEKFTEIIPIISIYTIKYMHE